MASPEVGGPEYEGYVSNYRSLAEEITDRQWLQAGVVAGVKKEFGGEGVRHFANDVARSYSYLMRSAQTWELFRGPERTASENKVLSFSHHMAVLGSKNPEEWLALAEDDNLDSKTLEDLVRQNKDLEGSKEIQGVYFEAGHMKTCPTCRGRGKIPEDADEDNDGDGTTGSRPEPTKAKRGMTIMDDEGMSVDPFGSLTVVK